MHRLIYRVVQQNEYRISVALNFINEDNNFFNREVSVTLIVKGMNVKQISSFKYLDIKLNEESDVKQKNFAEELIKLEPYSWVWEIFSPTLK